MVGQHRRELVLLATLMACAFVMVSLVGYSPRDVTLLSPGVGRPQNPCGPLGALVADALFRGVGHGAWATFLVMVGCILALAGRSVLDLRQGALSLAFGATLLTSLHLLFGPAEPWPAGGAVGATVAGILTSTAGVGGSWLAVLASGLLLGSALFQVRWDTRASKAVDVGERVLPAVGTSLREAAATLVASLRNGVSLASQRSRGVALRSWAALRREAEPSTSGDDTLAQQVVASDPGVGLTLAPIEASTAAQGAGELAEVHAVPTEGQPHHGPDVASLFPRLSMRGGTGESVASSDGAPAEEMDEPTQPSDAPTAEQGADPETVRAQVHRAVGLDVKVTDDGGEVTKKRERDFRLPKLSFLDPVPAQNAHVDAERLQAKAARINETLASFKVPGGVTDIRVGPVVTTFEYVPAQGISVRKLSRQGDDLAMALKALSVRIVAPVPGKGVAGIEIPSETRLTVFLRELLACDKFTEGKRVLPLAFGKDVEGEPVVEDLASMPHLLVGGLTGSGKSVGLNGMLMSLLYSHTPNELRLLLVDPKGAEFQPYDGIPHLIHPVVTDAKKAAAALNWAVREMERRYALLARWEVRNIATFNRKVDKEARRWTRSKAFAYAGEDGEPAPAPQKLPFIVVVIDELADLMQVASKDVETAIARLTQKARACGIHLILATQRPSTDVITGLIKSNLPSRVSFKLRTGIDSRTILDQNGAEALLGKGDMLYLSNTGADVTRVHGPFVSDEEVRRVMDFLREQGEPDYVEDVTRDVSPEAEAGGPEADVDALFDDAVVHVHRAQKASASMIQRQFRIGYNRAARIIDQMESRGIVGPADGAKPREVLGSATCP